jgi:hypothetical protein
VATLPRGVYRNAVQQPARPGSARLGTARHGEDTALTIHVTILIIIYHIPSITTYLDWLFTPYISTSTLSSSEVYFMFLYLVCNKMYNPYDDTLHVEIRWVNNQPKCVVTDGI